MGRPLLVPRPCDHSSFRLPDSLEASKAVIPKLAGHYRNSGGWHLDL